MRVRIIAEVDVPGATRSGIEARIQQEIVHGSEFAIPGLSDQWEVTLIPIAVLPEDDPGDAPPSFAEASAHMTGEPGPTDGSDNWRTQLLTSLAELNRHAAAIHQAVTPRY